MIPVIAVVPGTADGQAALHEIAPALDSLSDIVTFRTVELGPEAYRRTGVALPDESLAALRRAKAIVIATPPVPGPADTDIPQGVLEHGIVFALRRSLTLGINLRVFRGAGERSGTDIAVVRENSEGAYFSPGNLIHGGTQHEIAVQGVVTSAAAVERTVRFAFELAMTRRRSLVIAHKTRVLTVSGSIWTQAAQRVGAEFPEVAWRVEAIDTCCGRVVADPGAYDVIVSDNVFGDILADVVSAVAQASEYSVSAEYATHGVGPSLFEPMHDSHASAGSHHGQRHLGLTAAVGAAVKHIGEPTRGNAILASVRAEADALAGADA